ncbi:hypothetical protein [Stenotrophomonas rhizophila]|nr:hypothetical protein [Stenotrophomonas rhizophila]
MSSIVSPHFLHRNPTEPTQTAAMLISAGIPAAVLQMKSKNRHAAPVAVIQALRAHGDVLRRRWQVRT